jgi:hypothetical protein
MRLSALSCWLAGKEKRHHDGDFAIAARRLEGRDARADSPACLIRSGRS